MLVKHHAVDGIFAAALLSGYFVEHLAQNKLDYNAEPTRGHCSSEVPKLKYTLYIFKTVKVIKNFFSFFQERALFNRGEVCKKNKQRETLWNIFNS